MTVNAFAVSTLVSKTMTEYNENFSMVLNIANQDYKESFEQKNYATGGTINIKIPGYPAVEKGLSVTPTGIQDLYVPYTIDPDNDMYSVTRELNVFEQKVDLVGGEKALTGDQQEAIVDNYAEPSWQSLQVSLEEACALRLKTAAFYSPIMTPADLGGVNTYSAISSVETMMYNLQLMKGARSMIMNFDDANAVSDSLQNSFNTALNKNVSQEAYVGGSMDKGRLGGLDIFRSNQFLVHNAGPLNTTAGITVSSLSADGMTLTLAGVPSNTSTMIYAGDRIAIPSVFLLQAIGKAVTRYTLVVTASQDADGNGDGTVDVVLSYPLLASGEHANVASLPAGSAPVSIFPDYKLNFAMTRAGLSAVPLMIDDIYGAANSARTKSKVPVKVVLQGSATEFTNVFRMAQLVGIKAFAPYLIALPSAV